MKKRAAKGTGNAACRFRSRIERRDDGLRMHIVPLPEDLANALVSAQVRRVDGKINGLGFNRGLQSLGDGTRFLSFGQKVLRELGVRKGDEVDIVIAADLTPDLVDVPVELTEALAQDDEANARWIEFTPGKRRSLAHYVHSAKRVDTRVRRAVELVAKIRTYTLYGDEKR